MQQNEITGVPLNGAYATIGTDPGISGIPSNRRREQAKCIMVVDDEQSILNIIAASMEYHGVPVRSFTNPLDAVCWFEANFDHVALVLLDMKNPRLSGERCFSLLQAVHPSARIALMSGNADPLTIDQLLQAGALRFFAKPFDLRQMVDWALHSGMDRP